jgi:hypothetical protein
MPMMKRVLALITVLLFTCTAQAAEYLALNPGQVIYVNWIETQGNLNGEIQVIYDDNATIPSVKVVRNIFQGVTNGSALRLSFVQKFLGSDVGTTIGGTFNRDTLKLDFPAQGGGFTTIRFTSTNIAKFNAAVIALKQAVSKRAQAAEAARRTAEEQRRRDDQRMQQENGIKDSNAALVADLQDLEELGASVRANLKQIRESLQILKQGLAEMLAEVQSYESNAATFTDCENAYAIRNTRAYEIGNTLGYKVGNSQTYEVNSAADTLERETNRFLNLPVQLDKDFQTLTRWVNTKSGAITPPAYGQRKISDAIAQAQELLATSAAAVKNAHLEATAASNKVDSLKARIEKASESICP